MAIETEIQHDVDTLRGRFSDTKSLYREACALLFFRYGITPTASKLYQYVRKGSMSAPTEALARFWDDLRAKARVEIDHPDLPDELKNTAAEAIAQLWRQASAVARSELAALRIEIQAQLERSQDEQRRAHQELNAAQAGVQMLREQLDAATQATGQVQTELEAERRAHAGAAARLQELQRHLEDARAQQDGLRGDFSAELARAREAVEAANVRADGAERRALMEIEQERQARARADKLAEALRAQLAQAEAQQRDQALAQAETVAQLRARLEAAVEANRQLTAASEQAAAQTRDLREQLDQAQREGLQFKSDAATVRELLDRLTPPAAVATKPPSAKTIRAAKSPKSAG